MSHMRENRVVNVEILRGEMVQARYDVVWGDRCEINEHVARE